VGESHRITVGQTSSPPEVEAAAVHQQRIHMRSIRSSDGGVAAVQQTADDAISGKLSAAALGYLSDPYLPLFAKAAAAAHKRPPIINRGNFARVACIDKVIHEFLGHADFSNSESSKPQIVSLGAGKDTSFFRLQSESRAPAGGYFELDFAAVMEQKLAAMSKAQSLQALMKTAAPCSTKQRASFADNAYHLLSADLRDIRSTVAALLAAGADRAAPTLIIAECVLVYMEPVDSAALLAALSNTFTQALFVSYEMLLPHDSFGQMMVSNIQSRGCMLPGYTPYPTLSSQIHRFHSAGWEAVCAMDMLTVHDSFLDAAEVKRVARIEPLDELEEWHLIMVSVFSFNVTTSSYV
jgi:tRNA wybutosine-synthesizing protein 4